ncbi:MAG: DUF4255 domain-containing protein [Bernardetiaceae bacterium]|nr:DUF4255 domain-containing protein [Bernardetiaceae bacterium]
MIYAAFSTIADELNSFFKSRFGQTEDLVLISNIVNQDGSTAIPEENKVVLTLTNLERETLTSVNRTTGGNRSININIYVLMTAYFTGTNYPEALKFVSAIISHFQANAVLTHQNTPDLDPDIHKLVFEIVNLDMQALSHVWGMLGSKYMPSVLYKVRMVTFQEGVITTPVSLISGVGSKASANKKLNLNNLANAAAGIIANAADNKQDTNDDE